MVALGGPILLTPHGRLDGVVRDYLWSQRASVTKVVGFGGTAALGDGTLMAAVTGPT